MKKDIFPCVLALAALALAAPRAAHAQLITLANFNYTNGGAPFCDLILSGTTLYGTTYQGGMGYGTVFSVPLGGGNVTTLANFNGTSGTGPAAGLTLIGGTLYGTASQGGANSAGTVFSVPLGGGPITTLATFNNASGAGPYAGLTLSADGKTFYGTTDSGGAGGNGTVFSVPVGGGTVTALATNLNTAPNEPEAGLTLSADGKTLYGTAYSGGAGRYGTVFSVPVGGGSLTTLATFNNANGSEPQSGLTLVGGTLYGTTSQGGTKNAGTVFSVPVGGGAVTTLVNFNGTNGGAPVARLTLSADGKTFYGTTQGGGANSDGTVFSLALSDGTLTTLATFAGANGAFPSGGLTLSADGRTLYGTTESGGTGNVAVGGNGTVFSLAVAPEPSAPVTLALGALSAAGLALRAHRRKPRSA